jgi:glucosamine--fructose-6-phosphate aminotransferase (isomerizing)
VAQLLGQQVSDGVPLDEAMRTVCRRLHGAFTLVAVDRERPEVVVAARRNSPLVVGVGEGENFVASDVAAFIEHTRRRSSSARTRSCRSPRRRSP